MPFTREEFPSRIAGTKERMERRGIDVPLISGPANMNYLTGYDAWSFYVPQCVVVAPDAEEPIWIGRKMDAYYFTATSHDALVRKLPDARFQDAKLLVNWVRSVKSEAEIDYMRQAARILERVVRTGVDPVRPGVRQCDADAAKYVVDGLSSALDAIRPGTTSRTLRPPGAPASPRAAWSRTRASATRPRSTTRRTKASTR